MVRRMCSMPSKTRERERGGGERERGRERERDWRIAGGWGGDVERGGAW